MQVFPAGLLDSKIEIFGEQFRAWCLSSGQRLPFSSFPAELKQRLANKLNKDKLAMQALTDWGVAADQHLERYTFCMYAGFDLIADFESSGELTEPEYHNQCGIKDTCPHKGNLCTKHLNVANGKLSPREIEVTILIGKSYTDRQIAIELGISPETVRNHKNSTERKAGVIGKVGIAAVAHQFKLI